MLFAALAKAVLRRISGFDAQELTNTAWAFATLDQLDKKLCRALARAALLRMGKFNA